MRRLYLAEITFDEDAVDVNGEPVDLRWPDGSKFKVETLDGPLNDRNQLVEEFLFRGVGNKFGIGVKVLEELRHGG